MYAYVAVGTWLSKKVNLCTSMKFLYSDLVAVNSQEFGSVVPDLTTHILSMYLNSSALYVSDEPCQYNGADEATKFKEIWVTNNVALVAPLDQ